MKYKIYEIPGVKIGCCQDEELRIKEQQGFNDWIILAETDDIMLASDMERSLQRQKGYLVDRMPYYRMIENGHKTSTKKAKAAKENFAQGGLLGARSRSEAKVAAAKRNIAKATAAAVAAGAPGKAGRVGGKKTASIERTCTCGRTIKGAGYFLHVKYCKIYAKS